MEFDNEIPIYLQIMAMIKTDLVIGKILKGDKLLSTRDMAVALKVNPNTIARVYRELESESICFTKRGMGTFITEDESKIESLKEQLVDDYLSQFMKKMEQLNYSIGDIITKLKRYEEATHE